MFAQVESGEHRVDHRLLKRARLVTPTATSCRSCVAHRPSGLPDIRGGYRPPVHRLRKGLTYGARRNCHVQVRVNYLDVVEGPIHGEGRPVRVSAVEDPEKCTELGVG